MRGRKVDPVRQARIEQLSRAGLTVTAIAAELGVCTATVVTARARAGLTKYQVRPFTPEEDERIDAMLTDGASYKEVARTIGRHRQSIARRFPGRGWSTADRDAHTRVVRGAHQRPQPIFGKGSDRGHIHR